MIFMDKIWQLYRSDIIVEVHIKDDKAGRSVPSRIKTSLHSFFLEIQ